MTNVERKKRGMTADELCPRCYKYPESIMHLAKDCDEVKDFWSSLIDLILWSKLFSIVFHNRMDWNISSNNIGIHHLDWSAVFGITVHDIWKDMNSLIFAHSSTLGTNMLFNVLNQVGFISKIRGNVHHHPPGYGSNIVIVSWTPTYWMLQN